MITLTKEAIGEIVEAGRVIGADDVYIAEEKNGYCAILTTKDMLKMAFKTPPESLTAYWARVDFGFIAKAAPKAKCLTVTQEKATAKFDGSDATVLVMGLPEFPDEEFESFESLTYHTAPVIDTKCLAMAVEQDKSNPNSVLSNIHVTDKYAEATNRRVLVRVNFEERTGMSEAVMSPDLAKLVLSGASYDVMTLTDRATGNVSPAAIAVKLDSGWRCMFRQTQREYQKPDAHLRVWTTRPITATLDPLNVRKCIDAVVIEPEQIIFKTKQIVFKGKNESVQSFDSNLEIGDKEYAFDAEYMGVFIGHCLALGEKSFNIMELQQKTETDPIDYGVFFNSPSGIGLFMGLRLLARKQ